MIKKYNDRNYGDKEIKRKRLTQWQSSGIVKVNSRTMKEVKARFLKYYN